MSVRLAVIELRTKEKVDPTLDRILSLPEARDTEEDDKQLSWSRATLHRFTIPLGYGFSDRPTHYNKAEEDPKTMEMRADYLRMIENHQSERQDIFFEDET